MILQLVINNVLHRPIRTIVSVIAVGVEVALVILIVGLTSGLLQETAKRIEGIGADIMLQPPSASVFLAFSGAPMPIKIGDKLREMKYVQAVAPVLLQLSASSGIDVVYGIDPKTFRDVSGGFVFLAGHDLQGADDILIDDWLAKSRHATAGSTLRMLDHEFHVAGIVEHGKGARLFVPISTLQDLSGSRDKASLFFIKCTRPERTQEVIDEISPIFQGYQIRPLKDYLSLMSSANLPGLDAFIESMIALAVSIGFLVILLSMYTTVIERTRDIGILKAIGASKGYIIRALLGESVLICVLGIAAGISMSYATRAAFLSSFPTLSILITPDWIVRSALIALAGGILGATYPAWLASRKDAIEALSYD